MKHTSKKLVYIFEEDLILRDGIQLLLEDSGYAVHALSDSYNIKMNSTHEVPSIILLDHTLAMSHCKSLISLLKSSRKMRNVPILILSSDLNSKRKALKLGADDIIKKPLKIEELLNKVATYTTFELN